MFGTNLSGRQQKVVEDAMDLLNAADLCFVMAIGVPGTSNGGIFTNMETQEAIGALMVAAATTMSHEPIEVPKATLQ